MLNSQVVCHAVPEVTNVLQRIKEGSEVASLESVNVSSQAAVIFGRNLLGSRVTVLTLRSCRIGDSGLACLGDVLRDTSIEYLNVTGNGIKLLAKTFLKAINTSCTLKGLNISNNPLERASVGALCQAISNSHVTDLDLSITNALTCSLEVATAARSLHVLRVGYNTYWPADCTLLTLLDSQCTVTVLDLTSSEVSGRCDEIKSAVLVMPCLKCLSLKHNSICPTGLVHIAAAVEGSVSLEDLSLACNPLATVPGSRAYNEKGVVALATAVLRAPKLKQLSLVQCSLGFGTNPFYDGTDHGGISCLCDTAKKNPSVTKLNLAENNFNDKTISILKRIACGKASFETPCDIATAKSPSTPFHYGHFCT